MRFAVDGAYVMDVADEAKREVEMVRHTVEKHLMMAAEHQRIAAHHARQAEAHVQLAAEADRR
jgi:hypothetical protein